MAGEQFVGSRGPLCDRDDTRSSPHLSVVALGCLNEGDERGGGQGHKLELTQLRARHGCHNKSRIKEMKHGPHSLQSTKGTLQNWIIRGEGH